METFSRVPALRYVLSARFPRRVARWSIGKCFTIRLTQANDLCAVEFLKTMLSRGKFNRGVDREKLEIKIHEAISGMEGKVSSRRNEKSL